MAPFHLPWSTFLAYVVILASILIAVFWALIDKNRDKEGDTKK